MEILSALVGVCTILLIVSCISSTIVLLPDYLKMEKLTRDLSDFEFEYEYEGIYTFKKKNSNSYSESITYNMKGRHKNTISYWRGYNFTFVGLNLWMEWFNPYLYYLRKKVEKRIFAVLERSYIEETK